MSLKQPDLWFLAALLLITAGGTVMLGQTGATCPEARHLSYHRHYWQSAFDALSASCGVGLLTYSFQEDYTPQGRWILTTLGMAGAALFIAAVAHAARRMQPADARVRGPHPLTVVIVFVVVQVVAGSVFLLATGLEHIPENSWRAIAAFSSLGWGTEVVVGQEEAAVTAWPLALLAWIGALGWPVWLLVVPRLGRSGQRESLPFPLPRLGRSLALPCGSYTLMLLLAALLISAFESPRGLSGRGQPGNTLSDQPWATRYVRSLVQTAAASGAGMPTESLAESDTSDGTKFTLSALLLIGGLGGSATGGVQWTLLLCALAGGAAALGWSAKDGTATHVHRWMHAGLACLLLLVLLALTVAAGMLLIENWTASRYQPPPSFADVLLDASSVVAGGNLSSGLTEAVTSRNLLSGIRQSADLYQYGMAWLMLAMLAGRMLPLVVLRRLGDTRPAPRESSSGAAQADSI